MNINNSRILVIGTYGQVGGSFHKLLAGKKNVIFTDMAPQTADIKKLDVTDFHAIKSLIEEIQPQVIINCVAYTAVDQSEKDCDVAMKINSESVKIMAEAAQKSGSVFIHYSTDYVFDGSGTRPWLESDKSSPLNIYGISKLAGENATLHCATKGYVFRTQWVYDKTGKNFVNTMLRLGAERQELSIVGDQIGAPTSSDVIAVYTIKALEKILAGKMDPGIYHLTCRGEVSWHGFAEEIFRLAREHGQKLQITSVKKIETKDFPTPAPRPKNSRLSLLKFESAIGEHLPPWQVALQNVMFGSIS